MKLFHTLLFLLLFTFGKSQSSVENLINTKRGLVYSDILKMEKSYQVFLPESYHYSDKSSYPVVYIIDGDYNFYYQTGIIESLSNISEKIPELIVVGISDSGNENYKRDCVLKTEKSPNGNAQNYLDYIEKELKPEIENKFRVSNYQILMGHSLGGLFTTNVFTQNPSLFSAYIAIDPSYWWEDYAIVNRADSLFKNRKALDTQLFVTLADSKQMGVHQYVGVLEKYFPDSKKWTFKYYENENHGSVGIVSVKDGLLKIFEDWELNRAQFYNFKTVKEVVQFYKDRSIQYDSKLRIPPFQFANIIYYYFRNEKMEDLAFLEKEVNDNFPSSLDDYYSTLSKYYLEKEKFEDAQNLLIRSISFNNAYKSFDVYSKWYFAKKNYTVAKQMAEKAIQIAKQLKVRQWQLNELESNLRKINKMISKNN